MHETSIKFAVSRRCLAFTNWSPRQMCVKGEPLGTRQKKPGWRGIPPARHVSFYVAMRSD